MSSFSDDLPKSFDLIRILRAISWAPDDAYYGTELAKIVGAPRSTIQRILSQLETAGLLRGQFEDETPQILGRPRRKLYWLTPEGRRLAAIALRQMGIRVGKP